MQQVSRKLLWFLPVKKTEEERVPYQDHLYVDDELQGPLSHSSLLQAQAFINLLATHPPVTVDVTLTYTEPPYRKDEIRMIVDITLEQLHAGAPTSLKPNFDIESKGH